MNKRLRRTRFETNPRIYVNYTLVSLIRQSNVSRFIFFRSPLSLSLQSLDRHRMMGIIVGRVRISSFNFLFGQFISANFGFLPNDEFVIT